MNLKGMATGIGSLPLKDSTVAVDLIFKHLAHAPFWPQLPKISPREGMLAQFSENLPGLSFRDGELNFKSEGIEQQLELFYEKFIAQDLAYFKISSEFAKGLYLFHQRLKKEDLNKVEFIKCQVTGPFTFCAGITGHDNKSILHDEILFQAMAQGLTMKLLWQLDLFKEFGKKIIVFFDEPYLTGVGSAYTAVDRRKVIEVYTELAAALKEQHCLVGIHCCGNTDWSMLTDISGIDIINFDAFNFQERFVLYADNLKHFLARGGIICWGIVPTQEYDLALTPESLVTKLLSGVEILVKKGLERKLILERMMISPACGLGTLDIQKVEGILSLLNQTSLFIRKNL